MTITMLLYNTVESAKLVLSKVEGTAAGIK
ncbi:MAG: hypothetical protein KJ757_08270 [Planctomycetes bacterium]|nr:hypothetical protein [Planctomycetota bacterium]MBU1518372.1 hypothetical protein [Planctomycetota bacterium]MBU2457354.1 hypothetical protein [Planctomycetota bacterium]MBU2597537.1 hypothetical protein [Planctomycetota bacterium]